MLNRPSATWAVPEADRSRDWDPDRAPGLRLSLMWLGMLIPLVAVVVVLVDPDVPVEVVVVPVVDVEPRLPPVDDPVVPEEEPAGISSTMNVSIRVAHPKDVSAPNAPSQ